jgi:hypothetical protein
LGNLDAVCQTRAKEIAFVIDENLGFVFETPERRGMNDAITIALKFTTRLWARLGDDTPA